MVTLSEESSSVSISTCQIGDTASAWSAREKRGTLATERQRREDSEDKWEEINTATGSQIAGAWPTGEEPPLGCSLYGKWTAEERVKRCKVEWFIGSAPLRSALHLPHAPPSMTGISFLSWLRLSLKTITGTVPSCTVRVVVSAGTF